MAAATAAPNKAKLSKIDAETIAEGEQISGDVDKRLRSSSGKTYQAGIVIQPDSGQKMGSIQEVLEAGGIDHAVDETEHAQDLEDTSHVEGTNITNQVSLEQGVNQLLKMVNNLQATVNSMDKKISANTTFQKKTEERLEKIEKVQTKEQKEMVYLNDCLQNFQVKVDILSDIVVKQHQEIEQLKSQITDVQARSMRNNITISGILEKPNENCIREVNQFIVDKLGIKDRLIPIEQAYRFGGGPVRPMLVILRSVADKLLIFEHVGNLKNQRVNGVQCFVSTQLPEVLNESRRKINKILADNKKKTVDKRLPFSAKQGQLLFKSKPIEAKIWVPKPSEMLKLTEADIEELNSIKLTDGPLEEKEESIFRAYAVYASTHSEVNKAYQKLKLMHGEATHIACAYNFNKVKPPYNYGGCDDGEHGASRTIAQAIKENGVTNIAVFVVQYFGGKKLGPVRFEFIKKTAASAIMMWQTNPHGAADPWDQEQDSSNEEAQTEF